LGLQIEIGTLEADPARDNPVEVRQRTLQRRVAVVVPIDVEADAQGPLLRSSERRRNRMTINYLGLRVARPQRMLPLPQIRSELRSCLQQFRIGCIAVGDGMRRRAGRGPGASDRGMGGEPLVEALILRPMHDDEYACEQHDDDGAERACHPGDRPKKAPAFARWIEEYRLAKHNRAPRLCFIPRSRIWRDYAAGRRRCP